MLENKLMVFVFLVAVFLVLYNLYASYRCVRSEFAGPIQKLFQMAIVWFIPFIGAVVVLYFANPEDIKLNYKSSDAQSSIDATPGWTGGD